METQQALRTVNQPTRIMVAVSRSTIKGYPHASMSSVGAFEFTLKKIVRPDASRFKILILHVLESGDIDDSHEKGRQMLAYFEKRCRDTGVACESWIKGGRPEKVICNEVKRAGPDILVVGSRGLGWFRRFFIKSVSECCARNAECAVLTVKRKPEDAPRDPADD